MAVPTTPRETEHDRPSRKFCNRAHPVAGVRGIRLPGCPQRAQHRCRHHDRLRDTPGTQIRVPRGLSFVTGLFVALFTFGVATVLGVRSLTDVAAGAEITPSTRYWAQLVIGVLLIAVAALTWFSEPVTPPWIRSVARRHPWLLAFVGLALGYAEAPTSVPYLSALAMLASRHPLPTLWPLLLVGYGVVAILPSLLILVLSTRRSPRARRMQRGLVRR